MAEGEPARPPAERERRQRELLRKAIHTAVGVLAFGVAPAGPLLSALGALALVFFNVWILPRSGGRRLWRDHELAAGAAAGIVLYPVAILALVLLFWRRLEVAAAAWGIFAFGDGAAGIVGGLYGRARLPWNRRKSWLGSLAYVLCGGLAAAALLLWSGHHLGRPLPLAFAVAAAFAAALFAAFLESQPQRLDDNATVPLPTALVLWGLLASQAYWTTVDAGELLRAAGAGLAVGALLAVPAYAARTVDRSGAAAGCALAATIVAFLGWRGFALFAAFFVLGSGATRLGYARKARAQLAQEHGGRRSARNAVANAGVPALAAVFAATTPYPVLFGVAFAAAFATAAGDTLSSELGQLWGGRTWRITDLQPVPRGENGGVSVAGTLAGVAGAAAIAALGWGLGLYPAPAAALVTAAGVAGNLADSVLGATLERRALLDNEGVNFAATLAGAALAALAAAAFAGAV